MSNENENGFADEAPAADEAPEGEVKQTQPFKYGEGDQIFIHGNAGKFIAVVEKAYANLRAAEAAYDGSFQTITKKGPLYEKMAPHYLCFLNNPGESAIAASEPDTELKVKSADYL